MANASSFGGFPRVANESWVIRHLMPSHLARRTIRHDMFLNCCTKRPFRRHVALARALKRALTYINAR
jgi:hypothetical protein